MLGKTTYPRASDLRDRPLPPSPSLILVASEVSWEMPWAGRNTEARHLEESHTGLVIYRPHDKPEFDKAPTLVNKAS